MQNLQNLMIFAQVIESGGFSKAAQQLGIANSSVSKRIQALEASLGVRLLQRSTRSLRLTEEGQLLYQRCAQVKEQVEAIAAEASGFKETPRGTIRLSAPPLLAHARLTSRISGFLERYPEVSLEIELTESPSDLQAGHFDLSIRTGDLGDSSMVAQRLCTLNAVLCASPAYLERHGAPTHPDQLVKHNYLAWRAPGQKPYTQLVFRRGMKSYPTRIAGNFSSTDAPAIKEAAIGGSGITLMPDIVIEREIESGLLKVLLPEYGVYRGPLSMVYHRRDHLPAKVKVAAEFIREAFR
tara:strand:- start:119926 stop:120813 length:888 start_codon:yes stop_codon:yes gene_type:complete